MIMASVFAMAAALAVILISGEAIFRLLTREAASKTPIAERAGLTWLLGAGYVSLATFVFGFVCKGAVLAAAIAGVGLWMFGASRKWGLVPRVTVKRLNVLEWVLVLLFLGQLIFMLWRTPQVMLGWDSLLLWEAKARIAAEHGGVLPHRYFTEPPFCSAQLRYPLFLPYTESWFYFWLGRPDQAWVRALGPLMYVSGILILVGAAQRLGATRLAAMTAGALLFFVPQCFSSRWNVLEGYADFPLGAALLAAASRLPELGRREPSMADARLFAILSGLLAWVKQEGLYLWLILAGLAVTQLLLRRRGMLALRIVGWSAIIGGPYLVWLRVMQVPADLSYYPPTLENLHRFSGRILPVAQTIGWELMNPDNWSFLWFGVLAALGILLMQRSTRRMGVLLGSVVIASLGLYVWPFVLSSFESYENHMAWSLPRLILQLAPTGVLLMALAMPRPPRDSAMAPG